MALHSRLVARLFADPASGCVVWTGAKNAKGYGRFHQDGRLHLPHRMAYEDLHGPIRPGFVIDHLCRNPACCNPDHLEAVTLAENTRRGRAGRKDAIKTHCPKGHPYDEANTYRPPNGHRHCRTCVYARQAETRSKAKAMVAESGGSQPAAVKSESACQSEGSQNAKGPTKGRAFSEPGPRPATQSVTRASIAPEPAKGNPALSSEAPDGPGASDSSRKSEGGAS